MTRAMPDDLWRSFPKTATEFEARFATNCWSTRTENRSVGYSIHPLGTTLIPTNSAPLDSQGLRHRAATCESASRVCCLPPGCFPPLTLGAEWDGVPQWQQNGRGNGGEPADKRSG